MRRLDYAIARNQVVRPDGTIDQAAQSEYQTATRAVTDAFGDYMMFRFAHNTDEGRAYMSAQQELADRERRLQEVIRNYPRIQEEIQRNPGQEERVIRDQIRFYEEHGFIDCMGRGIGQPNRSTELRTALDQRNEARTALQTAERNFQDSVRRRLQAAGPGSFHVPLHQSANGFSAGLRTDPVEVYQQFQNYLTARLAYADQVQSQGTDAAALEAHYAPSAPALVQQPPLSIRFLSDPQAGPLDDLLNPFRLNPLPGPDAVFLGNDSLPIAFNNPSLLVAANHTFTWPPTTTISFEPPAIPTDDAATSPLFYLAAPGVVRPLQADDSLTAGAVWVYNTDTRRYEMMRDLPVIAPSGDGSAPLDLSAIDLSNGSPRPVARRFGQGTNSILTIDLRTNNNSR
jgi:hypothetical protein